MWQVHQEVAELYRKAIKKCQLIAVEPGEDMWSSCRDRLATLEYNLAELHMSLHREQVSSCRDHLATLEYNLAELHMSLYREQMSS